MESRDLLELVENMKDFGSNASKEEGKDLNSGNSSMMTINSRDYRLLGGKGANVPFHLPNIPRPQDEFQIFANNLNQPFDHVWLERSVDGSRYVHPLRLTDMDVKDVPVGSGKKDFNVIENGDVVILPALTLFVMLLKRDKMQCLS
ncbi:hypothetical protein ACHQM5_014943 [Ranunculus cassubicifolius]